MLRGRRRRRRRASGERLAAAMPAKFDAILADDDSARHAHIDSRATKPFGKPDGFAASTREPFAEPVNSVEWCGLTGRTKSSCGQHRFTVLPLLRSRDHARYDAFTSEAT